MRIYRCDKCGRKVAFVFWMSEINIEVCVNCYQKQIRRAERGKKGREEIKRITLGT